VKYVRTSVLGRDIVSTFRSVERSLFPGLDPRMIA
jgi:hypothetical protein